MEFGVAEWLTFTRLLLHSVLFREQTQAYAQKLQADLALIDNPVLRDQLTVFRFQLGQEIIRYVITISPIAWVLCIITSPIWLLFVSFRGMQSFFRLGRRSMVLLAEHL